MSNVPHKLYYVYLLCTPADKIFYVGKGKHDRMHWHEKEAKKDCDCYKCRKIRKIWRAGGEVRKYVVFETNDEGEAYDYEADLIEEIGLKNLCNIELRRTRVRPSPEFVARLEARREYLEAHKEMERINREMIPVMRKAEQARERAARAKAKAERKEMEWNPREQRRAFREWKKANGC